jgi:phage shock protein PspC (stress-responsive transcriptional regulator)
MNKTVNINLAGIFFHIDEDAYLKLQRYLEAIKRSFTDSEGRSEIISDIEARIAELFTERVKNTRQVIGNKEVDDVITIMGQPEDYLVDDEIFDDEPTQHYNTNKRNTSSRKLYRDTDNSYVGGVSSGLGHYFGIDTLWIRLIWILLIFGAGTGVLLYILLWCLVPEALTTSEKLQMTGEQVNISNIEKKIKDGFDSVSTAVQNVDFKKHGDKIKEGFDTVSDSLQEGVKKVNLSQQGDRIKSSSSSLFDTLGTIVMFFLNIFSKFFGIILMVVGAVTLISLLISLFSVNLIDSISFPGIDFLDVTDATRMPVWLFSLLLFLVIGIIAFFIFYLGLKILISNMKSIGKTAKYTLFGLWIISFITLLITLTRFGLSYQDEGSITKTEKLIALTRNDTIRVKMNKNDLLTTKYNRSYGFKTAYNENDEKVLFSQGVRLIVKTISDSVTKIRVERSAKGHNIMNAMSRAKQIDYNYKIIDQTITLDSYFKLPLNESKKGQEVTITLYLPEGSILFADQNTFHYHSNESYYDDILDQNMEEHYLKIITNGVECTDCQIEEELDLELNISDKNNNGLEINEDGIRAKSNENSLQIDDKGIKAQTDNIKVNINEDGIKITTDDN